MHFWRMSPAEYRALPLDLYVQMTAHQAEVVKARSDAGTDPWGA